MKKMFLLALASGLCVATPSFAQTDVCSQKCNLAAAECLAQVLRLVVPSKRLARF